jgi:hypothetical protein
MAAGTELANSEAKRSSAERRDASGAQVPPEACSRPSLPNKEFYDCATGCSPLTFSCRRGATKFRRPWWAPKMKPSETLEELEKLKKLPKRTWFLLSLVASLFVIGSVAWSFANTYAQEKAKQTAAIASAGPVAGMSQDVWCFLKRYEGNTFNRVCRNDKGTCDGMQQTTSELRCTASPATIPFIVEA